MIPRGSGYLYIDQGLVDLRKDCLTLESARKHMQQKQEEMRTAGVMFTGFYRLGPVLVCEQGAKLLPGEKINSGGYVVDTLEAALWCLLRSEFYGETALKAVNLGGDTDTTAAVAGGLAGLFYGFEAIPGEWIDTPALKDEIFTLVDRFQNHAQQGSRLG